MMGNKPVPPRETLVDYNYAVAGHAGTLCDPDGELFIKPCTTAEIDFYGSANAEHPEFAELMPIFMGTLLLNDATDIQSINEQLPVVAEHISEHLKEEVVALAHALHPKPSEPTTSEVPAPAAAANDASGAPAPWAPGRNRKIATDTAIVLENSAYGYKRPNIMDCKLGVRLWADDAPAEKKKRFDRISNETTHRDLGFRVAGMRVFRGAEDPAELDHEEYKKYDKDWGRLSVDTTNIVDSIRRFIFNKASGVDEASGKLLARAFYEDLLRVEDVLAREESRMYSASLLFVCEGDGDALRHALDVAATEAARAEERRAEKAAAAKARAIKAKKARRTKAQAAAAEDSSGRSNTRVDSGIDMGDDGELIVPQEGECDDADDNNDDELDILDALDEEGGDDALETGEEDKLPRIYSLRLIDFAHADWVPGQGPDENVLKGVRSLVKIFEEISR